MIKNILKFAISIKQPAEMDNAYLEAVFAMVEMIAQMEVMKIIVEV